MCSGRTAGRAARRQYNIQDRRQAIVPKEAPAGNRTEIFCTKRAREARAGYCTKCCLAKHLSSPVKLRRETESCPMKSAAGPLRRTTGRPRVRLPHDQVARAPKKCHRIAELRARTCVDPGVNHWHPLAIKDTRADHAADDLGEFQQKFAKKQTPMLHMADFSLQLASECGEGGDLRAFGSIRKGPELAPEAAPNPTRNAPEPASELSLAEGPAPVYPNP